MKADAGGIDTSIYEDAVSEDPLTTVERYLDLRNKLLNNVHGEQQAQENAIRLATEWFGAINNAASGLLSDPDLGTKDITSKLWDTLGRSTKGDTISAQHAVQFMEQFPDASRPNGLAKQVQAVKNRTVADYDLATAEVSQLATELEIKAGKLRSYASSWDSSTSDHETSLSSGRLRLGLSGLKGNERVAAR